MYFNENDLLLICKVYKKIYNHTLNIREIKSLFFINNLFSFETLIHILDYLDLVVEFEFDNYKDGTVVAFLSYSNKSYFSKILKSNKQYNKYSTNIDSSEFILLRLSRKGTERKEKKYFIENIHKWNFKANYKAKINTVIFSIISTFLTTLWCYLLFDPNNFITLILLIFIFIATNLLIFFITYYFNKKIYLKTFKKLKNYSLSYSFYSSDLYKDLLLLKSYFTGTAILLYLSCSLVFMKIWWLSFFGNGSVLYILILILFLLFFIAVYSTWSENKFIFILFIISINLSSIIFILLSKIEYNEIYKILEYLISINVLSYVYYLYQQSKNNMHLSNVFLHNRTKKDLTISKIDTMNLECAKHWLNKDLCFDVFISKNTLIFFKSIEQMKDFIFLLNGLIFNNSENLFINNINYKKIINLRKNIINIGSFSKRFYEVRETEEYKKLANIYSNKLTLDEISIIYMISTLDEYYKVILVEITNEYNKWFYIVLNHYLSKINSTNLVLITTNNYKFLEKKWNILDN